MARKIEVSILGDSSSLERAFARSERSARGFSREMDRAGRGTLAASGVFKGLGRSVAFASASFLGAAGFTAALVSTVKAAEESQRVLGQTKVALEDTGKSWAQYGAQIEKATKATSELSGFDDERLLGTFALFERRTKNVTEALRENAIAVDVARGRNISLEAAASLVNKAGLGMAGSLRRVGIAAQDGASSVELLNLLSSRFAGSAEAYGNTAAGAQDRFRVALENTQEIIGTALLPSLTKILDKATKWLNNTNNQKKIQDAANNSVHRGTVVVENLHNAYNDVKTVWGSLSKIPDPFGLGHLANMTDMNAELRRMAENVSNVRTEWEKLRAAIDRNIKASLSAFSAGLTGGIARSAVVPEHVSGHGFVGRTLTSQEQLAIVLSGDPSNVGALTTMRGLDQKALNFALRQIRERRGNTAKFATEAARLAGDVASITSTLVGISADRDAKAKAAADKRRQAAAEAARAAALAKSNKAARQLGWLDFAVERAGATDTSRDDVRANRNLERWLKAQIRTEGRSLELVRQLWQTRQRIRDLNKKNATSDPLAGLIQVSSKRLAGMLAAGTGLNAAGRRVLGANIAGAEIRPIHNHLYLDGREVASSVNRHNARSGHRTGNQTSGRVGP